MEALRKWLADIDHSKQAAETTPKDAVLVLRNVHKTYLLGVEGVPALRGVSLTVRRGEWVVIYGTSGGGKTSLLNICGTIDKPTKGEVEIGGTVVNDKTPDDVLANIRLEKLGFVFQTFNLLGSMTALENVTLPMSLRNKISPADRKRLAAESLDRVGLGHRINQYPGKLSGGEQQRTTIARAIANRPEILLLDEPTGDLDTNNTMRIIELLYTLNHNENMTFLMVTHDVYLKNFAHRIIYMRDGKIAREEVVCPLKRQAAFEELRANVAKLGDRQHSKSSLNLAGQSAANVVTTEFRQPRDYETFSQKTGIPPVIPESQRSRQEISIQVM